MNILHMTTFLQGGAGRIVYDLAAKQDDLGHNVSVITSKTTEPGYCNYGEYIKKIKAKNIPLYQIDSSFKRELYLNLKVANKVRDIIVNNRINIIHTHASIPAMIAIIARAGIDRHIPIIQTMHGWGNNKTLKHELMDITIMNGLDYVIPVSKTSKKLLLNKGVDLKRLKVIYNGIDEDLLIDNCDLNLQELSNIKEKGYKIIGCIGSICERKNQRLLIEAYKNLANDFKSKCIFIGEGDYLRNLTDLVYNYKLDNNVEFYGYKENAREYIKYFDCLVLPSLSEGMPITVLEGFIEKTPVIGSDIPEIREIITDGSNGFLFKSQNVMSLCSAIKGVLISNEKKLEIIVKQAYQCYLKDFKVDIMIEQYLNLYNLLINYT